MNLTPVQEDLAQGGVRDIYIFGTGGHALSVADVAKSAGFRPKGFISPSDTRQYVDDLPIYSDVNELGDISQYAFAVALGDNFQRSLVTSSLIEGMRERFFFPPLIHQRASASPSSTIGEGTIVMANAVVGPRAHLGSFCIVNSSALVEHESVLEDFSSLAPMVGLSGKVRIGERSAICLGALIKQGVTVGADSIVGANSFLDRDLESSVIAYGNPAKIIRRRSIGDPYL